jgi:hypothetical protein
MATKDVGPFCFECVMAVKDYHAPHKPPDPVPYAQKLKESPHEAGVLHEEILARYRGKRLPCTKEQVRQSNRVFIRWIETNDPKYLNDLAQSHPEADLENLGLHIRSMDTPKGPARVVLTPSTSIKDRVEIVHETSFEYETFHMHESKQMRKAQGKDVWEKVVDEYIKPLFRPHGPKVTADNLESFIEEAVHRNGYVPASDEGLGGDVFVMSSLADSPAIAASSAAVVPRRASTVAAAPKLALTDTRNFLQLLLSKNFFASH